jgi:hypothetical protein
MWRAAGRRAPTPTSIVIVMEAFSSYHQVAATLTFDQDLRPLYS